MSGFDARRMMADLERMALDGARSRGFETVEAMLEHDRIAEARRAEAEVLADAARHRRAVVSSLLGRLRPDVAEALLVGKLRETDAVRTVRAWLATDKPTLVLSGGTGAGKTVAAALALCERIGSFQVLRAPRLGAAFERWQSDREDGAEALRVNVATLLVDDLGLEPLDDRRVPLALEEIFDARQTASRRTVVTTNLSRDAMRARYSDRVLSRLAQNAAVVPVDGDDMRRQR